MSIQDVNMKREWDGATVTIEVWDDDQAHWNEVDNYINMGYVVVEVVEV